MVHVQLAANGDRGIRFHNFTLRGIVVKRCAEWHKKLAK
jgi:hypothetical protein